MASYIDIHAHLDHCKLHAKLDEVITNAKKAGLTKIITNGSTIAKNRESITYADSYDIVEAALGLYPIDALKMSEEEIDNELTWIKKQKPIALGEVGIDHYWDKDNWKQQEQNFLKVIHLAEKIKRPLIVHSRGAEKETVDLLESSNVRVDMHCFSGNKKLVKKIEDNGWMLSIPANIIFSTQFQMVVQNVNLSNLLTETDSPYLGPIKGKWNEPANVIKSVEKIAEIKGLTIEETANNIFMNSQKFLS